MSAWTAGFSALFTVALALPSLTVFAAGCGSGDRRSRGEHLLSAAILGLLFATALSQRGVGPADTMSRWVVVGLLIFAVDLGGRKQGNLHPSTVVWALILGASAVLLRADHYGPALGVLRGSWQSTPDRTMLFVYHFGCGVGLALVYGAGVMLSTRIPRMASRSFALLVATFLLLIESTGWIRGVESYLLLHWPGPRWG